MKRLGVLFLLLMFLGSHITQAATTLELAVGTVTTVLTTQLDGLGVNAFTVASGTIDNRIGQAGNGYLICRVELFAVYAGNPTTGGSASGWFLKTVDGTNFEVTPTATIGLTRLPDFVIPVITGQTTTRVSVDVRCPAERFKVVVQNALTSQAMASSGNTVKILPITLQGN